MPLLAKLLREARSDPAQFSLRSAPSFNRVNHAQRFCESVADLLWSAGTMATSGKDRGDLPATSGSGSDDANLGKNKPHTATDIIKNIFAMNEEQAEKFLGQYRFDRDGLRNEMAFALHLEQYQELPAWSSRLKPATQRGGAETLVPDLLCHERSVNPDDSALRSSRQDADAAGPSATKKRRLNSGIDSEISLGEEIDAGFRGVVYRDMNNSDFLIKVLHEDAPLASDDPQRLGESLSSEDAFKILPIEERLHAAQAEAALFCLYYGDDAARAFSDGNDAYIRMIKVPGLPLSAVKTLPADAIEKYGDMLGRLDSIGIMHGDLHGDNILYDVATDAFHPIDFSNMKADYFQGSDARKNAYNDRSSRLWNSVVEQIYRKMPATHDS